MTANFDGKIARIVANVSSATGVSSEDVEKIMQHLGLHAALADNLGDETASVRLAIGQKAV